MYLKPEDRPGHPAARRAGPSCFASTTVWGLPPDASGLDPRQPGSISRSGNDFRPIPEAKTSAPVHADQMDSSGSDENSGNARCEGPCQPWAADAARPVAASSPTVPRGPDINAQLWRRLFAAGASKALFSGTEDPVQEGLAPPSTGLEGRIQNEPTSGVFRRGPACPSRRRNPLGVTDSPVLPLGTVSGSYRCRSRCGAPAAKACSVFHAGPMAEVKSNPPCRKSLPFPRVATRTPENRKARSNPRPW
jgi:hypothetical protein